MRQTTAQANGSWDDYIPGVPPMEPQRRSRTPDARGCGRGRTRGRSTDSSGRDSRGSRQSSTTTPHRLDTEEPEIDAQGRYRIWHKQMTRMLRANHFSWCRRGWCIPRLLEMWTMHDAIMLSRQLSSHADYTARLATISRGSGEPPFNWLPPGIDVAIVDLPLATRM